MTRGSKMAWIFAVLFSGLTSHTLAAEEHWSAPEAAAKRRNPIPPTAPAIEEGRRLFKQHCVTCHGPTGRGDGPAAAALKPRPADLATMAGHHPDGDLAWKIANGRGAMPPWRGTLSDNQIWILVTFLKNMAGTDSGQPDGGQHTRKHHHH